MDYRIRRAEEGRAVPLCEAGIHEAEDVVATLRRSGGVWTGEDHITDISYQFVLDESGAYCEIILSDDD